MGQGVKYKAISPKEAKAAEERIRKKLSEFKRRTFDGLISVGEWMTPKDVVEISYSALTALEEMYKSSHK